MSFHILIWYQLKKPSYFRTLGPIHWYTVIHWFISGKSFTSPWRKKARDNLVHSDAQAVRLPKQRQGAPPRLCQGCCCSGSASSRTVMTLSWNHQPINPTKKLRKIQTKSFLMLDVVFNFSVGTIFFSAVRNHRFRAMGDEMIFSSKFCVDTCNLAEFSGLFCYCFCDGDDDQLLVARGENRMLFHRIISDIFYILSLSLVYSRLISGFCRKNSTTYRFQYMDVPQLFLTAISCSWLLCHLCPSC